MDVEALIGAEEREQLLAGKTIEKVGYEERFDRKLISVIIPLLDEEPLRRNYLYVHAAGKNHGADKGVCLSLVNGCTFIS